MSWQGGPLAPSLWRRLARLAVRTDLIADACTYLPSYLDERAANLRSPRSAACPHNKRRALLSGLHATCTKICYEKKKNPRLSLTRFDLVSAISRRWHSPTDSRGDGGMGEERRTERRAVEVSQRDASRLGPKTFQASRVEQSRATNVLATHEGHGRHGRPRVRPRVRPRARVNHKLTACFPRRRSCQGLEKGVRLVSQLLESGHGGNLGVTPPSAPALRPRASNGHPQRALSLLVRLIDS